MKILALAVLVLPLLAVAAKTPSPTVEPSTASSESGCDLEKKAEYRGVASCKKCHFKHWASWKKTTMAKSLKKLAPDEAIEVKKKHGLDPAKDYRKDAKCLPCHTTGYGLPGGYPALVAGKSWNEEESKRAKKLGGVQCESCHGPGSLANVFKKDNEEYKRAEVYALGMHAPDKKACIGCHNGEGPTAVKGKAFDYDALTKDPKKIHKHVKMKFEH